jgi:hypothetical protein
VQRRETAREATSRWTKQDQQRGGVFDPRKNLFLFSKYSEFVELALKVPGKLGVLRLSDSVPPCPGGKVPHVPHLSCPVTTGVFVVEVCPSSRRDLELVLDGGVL